MMIDFSNINIRGFKGPVKKDYLSLVYITLGD